MPGRVLIVPQVKTSLVQQSRHAPVAFQQMLEIVITDTHPNAQRMGVSITRQIVNDQIVTGKAESAR
jgi:hypothetical protein